MNHKCFIFILIFVTISAEEQEESQINCLQIIKLYKNYVCYVPPEIEENFQLDQCNNDIIWTVTNSTAGHVQIEFMPCEGNTNFTIILYVEENNTTWAKHSKYYYSRLHNLRDDDDAVRGPKCSQSAQLQLEHVFSGHYKIEIIAQLALVNNASKYLTTEYIKYKISGLELHRQHQQRFADNKTYLVNKFHHPQHPDTIDLCFQLFQLENVDKKIIWNISCPVKYDETKCEVTARGQQSINCTLKMQKSLMISECQLFDLTPGEYMYERYIVNEPIRCNTDENKAWDSGSDCKWDVTLNLTASDNTISHVEIKNTNTSLYICITLILIAILFALILIIIYFLYKKIQKYKRSKSIPSVMYTFTASDDDNDEVDPSGILLLYARDCDVFMQTMSTFRQILQMSGNRQVFDIHDAERNAEILTETPTTWLHNKIMDKNIKTVLVLSKCGDYLLQKERSYLEPSCFDSLYNYGLRILLHSHSMSCNEIFVTKFSYFEESSPTTILSPDRRFNLDDFENLRDLLRALFCSDQLRDNVLMLFQEPCRHLIRYVNENPNYLMDILQVT